MAATSGTGTSRAGTYVGRHWRGQLSLWLSLLVNTVLALPLAIAAVVVLITYLAVVSSPPARVGQSYALFAALVALWLWQVVGVWRAGRRSGERGGWWIGRWGARGLALAAGLLLVAFWSLMADGIAQQEAVAADEDAFGRIGYSLTVRGDRLVVDGAMAWSLVGRFAAVLDDHPDITTVELNSNGGHTIVGDRMAGEVGARGLDTLVSGGCASACTIVFAAGRERVLVRGARLGFHSLSPMFGGKADLLMRLTARRMRGHLTRIGVPADFIERIERTPAAEVWIPSEGELVEAHIVTRIVE
jgi:hypothetical protein